MRGSNMCLVPTSEHNNSKRVLRQRLILVDPAAFSSSGTRRSFLVKRGILRLCGERQVDRSRAHPCSLVLTGSPLTLRRFTTAGPHAKCGRAAFPLVRTCKPLASRINDFSNDMDHESINQLKKWIGYYISRCSSQITYLFL